MSVFIQFKTSDSSNGSPTYTGGGSFLLFPGITAPVTTTSSVDTSTSLAVGGMIVKETITDTIGSVPRDPHFSIFRFYIVQLDQSNPEVVGIYSHHLGRKFWMYMDPTLKDFLRFWNGEPPSGPHPTKWLVSRVYSGLPGFGESIAYSLRNILHSKSVTILSHYWGFTTNSSPTPANFTITSDTSTGPLVINDGWSSPSPNQRYNIMTRYGTALTTSQTAPYLYQSAVDLSAQNQEFFFRADLNATIGTFPYYMHFAESEVTTVKLSSNITAPDISTIMNEYETVTLQSSEPIAEGIHTNLGRFVIFNQSSGSGLRAMADGSIAVYNRNQVAESADDYFTFSPVSGDVPYY